MDTDSTAALAAALAAVAAAGVSLVALPFTIRAANAAKAQTDLQRTIAEEAAQPYVWADVRGSDTEGVLLMLVVGNSGSTVATDVRVVIDPPLPAGEQEIRLRATAQRQLAEGLKSLAPGRRLEWPVAVAHEVLDPDRPSRHTVTVTGAGPYGPLKPLVYSIDLADMAATSDRPVGNLHLVRKAVEELASRFPKNAAGGPLRVQVQPTDADV